MSGGTSGRSRLCHVGASGSCVTRKQEAYHSRPKEGVLTAAGSARWMNETPSLQAVGVAVVALPAVGTAFIVPSLWLQLRQPTHSVRSLRLKTSDAADGMDGVSSHFFQSHL